MRSILKLGVPVVAAALALTACGGTSDSGDSGSAPSEVKIGFFGALTGDAANLGQNIKKGAQLAIDQYNATNPKTKITLVDYDSQGDPDQAPAWPRRPSTTRAVIGIVGPAFSGESKAADPLFNEAGLVTISASATNPALSTNGWKTFFRVLGNDASQGPAAAKYIQRRAAGQEGRRRGRRLRVRQGPGRHREERPRHRPSWLPTRSSRSRPTSARPSPRSRAPALTRCSSAATTPRPACSRSRWRTPASTPSSSSATASRTTASSPRPAPRPPRARS